MTAAHDQQALELWREVWGAGEPAAPLTADDRSSLRTLLDQEREADHRDRMIACGRQR